jgi:gliding motility-associated-like protein
MFLLLCPSVIDKVREFTTLASLDEILSTLNYLSDLLNGDGYFLLNLPLVFMMKLLSIFSFFLAIGFGTFAQSPDDVAKKMRLKKAYQKTERGILNNCLDLSQTTVAMSPEPPGCVLEPNTTYTWCATINNYNQPSVNWISAIIPVFGCAWDTTTLQPVGQLANAGGGNGTWLWTSNVTGDQTGNVSPNLGWYFDRDNDGNPGNNYGDDGECCWNVCFSIKTIDLITAPSIRPECFQTYNSGASTLNASMSLMALSDEQIGSWDGDGACFGDSPAPTTGCQPTLNLCPPLSVSETDARCSAPNGVAWINFPANFSARDKFSFLWFTNPPQQGDTLEDLFPGTYTVVGSSTTGCEYNLSVTVGDNFFTYSDTSIHTKCFNDSTGKAIVNLPNSGGPYTVIWNVTPKITNDSLIGYPAGIYTYSVKDSTTGCVYNDSVIIYTPEILNSFFDVDTNECEINNGSILADVSGGSGNYQYVWTNINLDTIQNQNTNILSGLDDGGYFLIVKDDSNCVRRFYVEVPQTVKPLAEYIPFDGAEFSTDTSYNLIDQSLSGTGPLVAWWWEISYNGNPVSSYASQNVDTYTFPDSGYYLIQLIVQNASGCKDTLLRKFYVKKMDYPVEYPNVFTPNNDGKNDLLVFKNLNQYPDNELIIYNRWGKKIFQQSPYLNDWNGDNQKDGTYYYIVKIPGQKNTEGFVTILR